MNEAAIQIRAESAGDAWSIERVTAAAFADAPHSGGTEHFIVNALREAGMLTVSRVATEDGVVVGHAAASPVRIDGADRGWYGLGPVSVLPALQRRGIGSALVMETLLALSDAGAAGCVVLGDPRYYERFGFEARDALRLVGVPPANFMALAFEAIVPEGTVSYHAAFQARG